MHGLLHGSEDRIKGRHRAGVWGFLFTNLAPHPKPGVNSAVSVSCPLLCHTPDAALHPHAVRMCPGCWVTHVTVIIKWISLGIRLFDSVVGLLCFNLL